MKKRIVKSKKRVPKFQDGVLFNKSMLDADVSAAKKEELAAKKMDYMKKSLTVDPLKSSSINTGSDIVNNLTNKPENAAPTVSTPKSVAAKNSKTVSDSYKKSLQGLIDKGNKSIDDLVKLGYGTKQGLTNLGLTAPKKATAPKPSAPKKGGSPKPSTLTKATTPKSNLNISAKTRKYRGKDGKVTTETLKVKNGVPTLTRTVQGIEKGKKSTYVKVGDKQYYKGSDKKVVKLKEGFESKQSKKVREKSAKAYENKKVLGNRGLATGSVQAVDEFWSIGGPGSKLASTGLRKLGNVGVKLLEKRAEKTVKDVTGKTVKKGINKLFGKVNADKLKFRSQVNRTQKGGLKKLLNQSKKTPKKGIDKSSLKWNANRLQARSRVNKAQREGLGKLLKRGGKITKTKRGDKKC